MMTKVKLDNLKELDTMTPTLDMAKLDTMINVALKEPQEAAQQPAVKKSATILQFPRAVWGGAGVGLAAALLLVTLNLPSNQSLTPVDTASLQFADAETDEDFELAAEMLIFETLGV